MLPEPPRISIIVPTYNSQEIIQNCLCALEKQSVNRDAFEIIVVDDGSTDKTCEIVKSFEDVRLIETTHGGPSVARNLGAKAASGEFIALTDSDCVPTLDWLVEITSPFQDNNIIGVKGTYRSDQKSLVARFVQLEYQYKYRRMAHNKFVDFIDTSSAAYRREIFLKNGGFDSAFTVASVEDQELSFRLAQKGYCMIFAPNAAVFHHHDDNLREYWRRKYGIGYWKAFMLRWLPQKTFSDSHTPLSQRLQIGLLALALINLLVGIFLPGFLWGAVGFLALFFVTGFSFWGYIIKNDGILSVVYPALLIVRALALGVGLFVGFLAPPQKGWHTRTSLSFGAFIVKRVFDILLSCIGLLASAPIILISSLMIILDSPGPAFFIQWRAGENGKPFRMVKLRTMVDGAEKQQAELIHLNPLKGPAFKIPDDPRVTRIGRWLRRWSIDELPQFWNILKGDMSLIGPRPEEMWVVDSYSDDQRKRLAFKPGLTGPMQVSGRGALDFEERFKLEIEYMQKYSIKKDISILFRSLAAVVKGKGAY